METYSIPNNHCSARRLLEEAFSRPRSFSRTACVINRNANWQGDAGRLRGYGRVFRGILGPSEALKPKLVSGEAKQPLRVFTGRASY